MKTKILYLFLGALVFFAGFMLAWHTGDYTMSDAQAKSFCSKPHGSTGLKLPQTHLALPK